MSSYIVVWRPPSLPLSLSFKRKERKERNPKEKGDERKRKKKKGEERKGKEKQTKKRKK